MTSTVPLNFVPHWLLALSGQRFASKSWGRRRAGLCNATTQALGHLSVIMGLTVAAFVTGGPAATLDDRGASQPKPDQVGISRPIPVSAAVPTAPVLQTTYVPARRTAALSTPTADQELTRNSHLDLVRQLQHELRRVGCYGGRVNGIWTPSTRRAMETMIRQVNAKLPTARPEPVHLALVQGQVGRICDQCADENQFRWRCDTPVRREVLAASTAPSSSRMVADLPKPNSEQSLRRGRRGPTEDGMGSGVSSELPQTAQVHANRRVASHAPRSRHRAIRHAHRIIVAHRHMRPTRYAYHRPRGLFALLFGW